MSNFVKVLDNHGNEIIININSIECIRDLFEEPKDYIVQTTSSTFSIDKNSYESLKKKLLDKNING